MKKLLLILSLTASFTSFAGLGQMVDRIEAKKCGKQLLKKIGKKEHDIRYLYYIETYPLIHVFAVYEHEKAEPLRYR